MLAYDKAVDATKDSVQLEYDLAPEQMQTARKYTRTGTRKAPTIYKFKQPPKRKPNATKGEIIAELASFLTNNCNLQVENLEIVNKERQLFFTVGDKSFDLTLIQKRKPKE